MTVSRSTPRLRLTALLLLGVLALVATTERTTATGMLVMGTSCVTPAVVTLTASPVVLIEQ